MVLTAVDKSQFKEQIKVMEVISEQDTVICLTDGRDKDGANVDTKISVPGSDELFSVI